MCHSCQVAYDPDAIRVQHGSNHMPLMGKNGHQFQNRQYYLLLCGDVDGGDNIVNSNFCQQHWSTPETLMNKQKQCQHLIKKPHRDLKMKSLSRQSLFSLPSLLFVGFRNHLFDLAPYIRGVFSIQIAKCPEDNFLLEKCSELHLDINGHVPQIILLQSNRKGLDWSRWKHLANPDWKDRKWDMSADADILALWINPMCV